MLVRLLGGTLTLAGLQGGALLMRIIRVHWIQVHPARFTTAMITEYTQSVIVLTMHSSLHDVPSVI